MKKSIFFTIITLCYLCIVVNSKASVFNYFIQLHASSDYSKTINMQKKLEKKGIPAYLLESSFNKKKRYHLRIGLFPNVEAANQFVKFQEYRSFWISKAKSSDDNMATVNIKKLTIRSFTSIPTTPYIYLSKKKSILAVYQKQFGIEASVLPSNLFLFFHDSEEVVLNDITGFKEDENTIKYGKSLNVFFRNETALSKYSGQIELMSTQTKIPANIIKEELSFFNDGYDARYTVFMEYNYKQKASKSHSKTGFDYCDQSKCVKYNKTIRSTQNLGNHLMIKLDNKKQFFIGKNVTAFSKQDSLDSLLLLIIFY